MLAQLFRIRTVAEHLIVFIYVWLGIFLDKNIFVEAY